MDETLKELLVGILIFEIPVMAVGVWFVDSPWKYLAGVFIGGLLAAAAAIHMFVTIRKNMDMNGNQESAANSYSVRSSMIRYAVFLIVFLFFALTDLVYPLAIFAGVMGLKAGAYLQPFVHKKLFCS